MNLVSSYENGNHQVFIFDDGTKVSTTINPADTEFTCDFPESIDLKITNRCDRGCKMCHERSTINGEHGNINAKFLDSLKPYTEVAIGGGNPLEHPDLIKLLRKLKDNKVLASMTIHQDHYLSNIELINQLLAEKLIRNLGVSFNHYDKEFIEDVKKKDIIVLHIIAGLIPLAQLKNLYDENLKVLVLGYKQFGRGIDLYNSNSNFIDNRLDVLKSELPTIVAEGKFKVISFDNLAIKQLSVDKILSHDEWERFYQGDDGTCTMYVDLVKEEFAISSTGTIREPIKDNIIDMFNRVKELANEG